MPKVIASYGISAKQVHIAWSGIVTITLYEIAVPDVGFAGAAIGPTAFSRALAAN